jgi:hypothetical protein
MVRRFLDSSLRSSLGMTVGVFVASVAFTPAPHTAPGVTFNLRITLVQPTGTNNLFVTMKGRYLNGMARLDPQTVIGPNSPVTENEYIVTTDTTSLSINPDARTWTEKSIETGTLITMMRAMNGGQTVSDFSVTVDSLGAGEPIDGRPTRHFAVTYRYTLTNRGVPTTTISRYEYWLADLPTPFRNPIDGRIRLVGAEKALMTDMLPKLLGAWAKLGKGTAVRVIARTIVGDQAYTRHIDLTRIVDADVDEGAFTVPAGFRHTGARGRGGP